MENIEPKFQENLDFIKNLIKLDKKSSSIIDEIKTCSDIKKIALLLQDYISTEDEIKKIVYSKLNGYVSKEVNSIKIINDNALNVFNQVNEFKSKKSFELLMFQISTAIFAIAFVLKCFNVI